MNISPYRKYINIALIFFLPLIIYLLTYPKTIGLVDSGLMAAAAIDLGIALPTGFPAYTIIAHIFSLMPISALTDRLYLLSIFSSLGILLVVFLILKELLGIKDKTKFYFVTISTCLSLAFSYQFWSASINIETFTLTNFFLFAIIFLLILIKRNIGLSLDIDKKNKQYLIILFVLIGISLGLSPIIVTISIPFIFWAYSLRKAIRNNLSFFSINIFILLLIFVAEYLFIISRALSNPFMNFGNASSLSSLLHLVTGRGFVSSATDVGRSIVAISGFSFIPSVMIQSITHYLQIIVSQFNPVFLLIIPIGIVKLFQKRFEFILILSLLLSNLLFSIFYISGNQEYWIITSVICLSIFIGIGIFYIFNYFENSYTEFKKIFILFLVVLPFLQLLFWYPKLNRSEFYLTKDYISNLYNNLEQNTVLIGAGNVFEGQSSYAREVLGYRKDVFPIWANFFYDFEWYRNHVSKISDIKISDNTVNLIKTTPKNSEGKIIESLVNDNKGKKFYLSNSFITEYLTDVWQKCNKGVCALGNYKLIPHGIVFEVVNKDLPVRFEENNFKFNGVDRLSNDQFFMEALTKQEIFGVSNDYVLAYLSAGDYFLSKSDINKALYYYKLGEKIYPKDNINIWLRLANVYQSNGNLDLAKLYLEKSLNLQPDNQEIRKSYESLIPQVVNTSQVSKPDEIKPIPTIKPNQPQSKKYISLSGFSFNYPSTWKVSEVLGTTTIKNPDESFVLQIKLNNLENQNFDNYSKNANTYGTLTQQGNALIPNFDLAYVKIWSDRGISKNQFFLIKGNKVFEILVYPSNSDLMRQFDQIVTSLIID